MTARGDGHAGVFMMVCTRAAPAAKACARRGCARLLLAVSLAAAGLAGCGTASTSREGWTYLGPDAALGAPPPVPSGELSPDVREARYREAFAAWQRRRTEAARIAADDCARRTGEGATPGVWTGHGQAFLDCMRAAGWSRVGNPL